MNAPSRRGSRSPWVTGITLVVVVVVFLLRQWGAPRTPAAPAPAPPPSRSEAPAQVEPGVDASARPASAGFGADVGFRSRERWMEHWDKHGREFAPLGIRTAEQYLAAAQELRDAAAGGDVLELSRADGVVSRFDRRTGSFLAFNGDGTIRTFFRPNDGEAYFRRQAQRGH